MKDHHLRKPHVCPHCGKSMDGALNTTDDEMPAEGDVSLCIYCGGWMVFAADLSARQLTAGERSEIAADPRCIQVRSAWEQAVRGKPQ